MAFITHTPLYSGSVYMLVFHVPLLISLLPYSPFFVDCHSSPWASSFLRVDQFIVFYLPIFSSPVHGLVPLSF